MGFQRQTRFSLNSHLVIYQACRDEMTSIKYNVYIEYKESIRTDISTLGLCNARVAVVRQRPGSYSSD